MTKKYRIEYSGEGWQDISASIEAGNVQEALIEAVTLEGDHGAADGPFVIRAERDIFDADGDLETCEALEVEYTRCEQAIGDPVQFVRQNAS